MSHPPPRAAVELRSASPGRLRVRVPRIARDAQATEALVARVITLPGVQRVEGNPIAASLLVHHDRGVTASQVVDGIASLAAGLEPGPSSPPAEPGLPPATASPPGGVHLLDRLAQALRRRRTRRPPPSGEAQALRPWHAEPPEALLTLHGWDPATGLDQGLDPEEAARRLRRFGPNALPPPQRRSDAELLVGQLQSVPVLLLLGSAALSLATAGLADAVAILTVVGINATVGFVTERSAERTFAALDRAEQERVAVIRGGQRLRIPAEEVVPGDLLLLSPASVIAADARLLASDALRVDESLLTGESLPVRKRADVALATAVPLADRKNLVFRGTRVTGGSGLAIAVATGAATEIGRIQALVGSVAPRSTPLQRELERLGIQLAALASAVCGLVFGIGLLRGQGLLPMLKTSVSLAVAAVPEGLPTVAVTTLALGIRRMEKLDVLIRKLPAVEALGSLQVLCLDKTGTLTANRMEVVEVMAGARTLSARQERLFSGGTPAEVDPPLRALLQVGLLCSETQRGGDGALIGSPTENALVRLALQAGLELQTERALWPVVRTRLRTESRSTMATLHRGVDGRTLLAMKGRPSAVLELCTHTMDGAGRVVPMTDAARGAADTENERFAGRALRVLGFARADQDREEGLCWLGLVGIADPVRPGIPELLERFHRAGVETVMITGDQSATAFAVAREIGLARDGRLEMLDSTRIDEIDPAVLQSLAGRVQVFSRVSPSHKLQIVQALQASGRVVAMTGDGINDGPALRAADVGVAMGAAGSAAAREVADVILRRDDLGTMITALEQGRTIHDDIRKAVRYILATNSSEILLTLATVAAGLGEPMTPMQLLWINSLTDVFPELALSVDPPEEDVLLRPPQDPAAPLFHRADYGHIATEGALITAGAAGAYLWGLRRYGAGPHAQTLAFTTITVSQLLHAISAESERHSIFDPRHGAHNPSLPAAVLGGIGLQVLAALFPPLRRLLGAAPVTLADVLVAVGASVAPFLANETLKTTRIVMARPPAARS